MVNIEEKNAGIAVTMASRKHSGFDEDCGHFSPQKSVKIKRHEYRYTTSSLFDSRPKVVSIIDATCSKCILTQMNRLDSTFAELLDAGDRVFVLNVPREDSAYFMYHFQPLINIGGHIIWDSNYYFESANEIFSSNPHRRIFLIDYQNRIVQMGNPLMNKEVMKEYQKSIEQLSPRIDFRL